MKNSMTMLIGLLVVLVLLSYMFLFQVRYDQVAVQTTFGSATEDSIKMSQKWPHLRWPWPIQGVTRYPNRLQILQDQLEEQQTLDGFAVIIKTYLIWRIEDPLAFFSNIETLEKAQDQLRSRLRDARAIISQYRFDHLVNTDPKQVKLAEVEKRVLGQLKGQLSGLGYGIRVEQFGIRRILLPEGVTVEVFRQMRTTRERMAQNTRSLGEAHAKSIKSEASTIREQIIQFAQGYAAQIKARGDSEAARFMAQLDQNAELAIFLQKLEMLKTTLSQQTQFILPAEEFLSPPDINGLGAVKEDSN